MNLKKYPTLTNILSSKSKEENPALKDWEQSGGDFEEYKDLHFLRMFKNHPPKVLKREGEVTVLEVTHPDHKNAIGRHLINPTENELERAIEDAENQGSEFVWVHKE